MVHNLFSPKQGRAGLLISQDLKRISNGLFSTPIAFDMVDHSLKFVLYGFCDTVLSFLSTSLMITFFFHHFIPPHHPLSISLGLTLGS